MFGGRERTGPDAALSPVKPRRSFVFNGKGGDPTSQPSQQQSTSLSALAGLSSSATADASVEPSRDWVFRGTSCAQPNQEQGSAPRSVAQSSFFTAFEASARPGYSFDLQGVALSSSQATQQQGSTLAAASTPGALAGSVTAGAQQAAQSVSSLAPPSPGSQPVISAKARAVGGTRRRVGAGRSKHRRQAAVQQSMEGAWAVPEGTGAASMVTDAFSTSCCAHAPASGAWALPTVQQQAAPTGSNWVPSPSGSGLRDGLTGSNVAEASGNAATPQQHQNSTLTDNIQYSDAEAEAAAALAAMVFAPSPGTAIGNTCAGQLPDLEPFSSTSLDLEDDDWLNDWPSDLYMSNGFDPLPAS